MTCFNVSELFISLMSIVGIKWTIPSPSFTWNVWSDEILKAVQQRIVYFCFGSSDLLSNTLHSQLWWFTLCTSIVRTHTRSRPCGFKDLVGYLKYHVLLRRSTWTCRKWYRVIFCNRSVSVFVELFVSFVLVFVCIAFDCLSMFGVATSPLLTYLILSRFAII